MNILVEVKNQYGTERIYPLNSNGLLIARIAGKKTLSREHIETAKQLGFNIIVKNQQL